MSCLIGVGIHLALNYVMTVHLVKENIHVYDICNN